MGDAAAELRARPPDGAGGPAREPAKAVPVAGQVAPPTERATNTLARLNMRNESGGPVATKLDRVAPPRLRNNRAERPANKLGNGDNHIQNGSVDFGRPQQSRGGAESNYSQAGPVGNEEEEETVRLSSNVPLRDRRRRTRRNRRASNGQSELGGAKRLASAETEASPTSITSDYCSNSSSHNSTPICRRRKSAAQIGGKQGNKLLTGLLRLSNSADLQSQQEEVRREKEEEEEEEEELHRTKTATIYENPTFLRNAVEDEDEQMNSTKEKQQTVAAVCGQLDFDQPPER